MNKAQFLQEKATFHLTYPNQDDLVFYQYFVKQHPTQTVGWLFLGREWEKRGKTRNALEAYRKALHVPPSEFTEEAREAYHTLLRKEKGHPFWRVVRTLTGLFALFIPFFLFETPVGEHPQKLSQYTNPAAANPPTAAAQNREHVEVIAVPEQLPQAQLREQVLQYVKSRRPALQHPYSVLLVPETEGLPLYSPLLFYQPARVKAVLRYQPGSDSFLTQTWFPESCLCEQDKTVQMTKKALAMEQRTLEQVLTLRNALYRTYQRKGRLPLQLQDLAAAYPANSLAALPTPVFPQKSGSTSPANPAPAPAAEWRYQPNAFRPEQPWTSMSEVLPLPYYPEPASSIQPLQVYVHQASFSMTVMSGSHVVRRYPIGIGKEQLTPEGYFTILQKINHPRGRENIYGSRGLIFASNGYAIHGTNNPQSIGQAMSLGCIRLHNADVEELYSFVSPGTEVIISDKELPQRTWSNPPRFLLAAGPEEETPKVIYHWLH